MFAECGNFPHLKGGIRHLNEKWRATIPDSLPADVLWGSLVTHSNEPQRTSAGRLLFRIESTEKAGCRNNHSGVCFLIGPVTFRV